MKRAIRTVVLACALTIGAAGSATAHELYVETPAGQVRNNHDLAKGTPPHPDGTGSAASHGTNVACIAVGYDGPVSIYAGGTSPCDPVPTTPPTT